MREVPIENKNIYRTLLDNIPQRVFFKDMDSVYHSCNKPFAQDLGITPEEIVGKTDFDFLPSELAHKYLEDDRRIIETGKPEEIEKKYIKNGKEIVVQLLLIPLRDEYEVIFGILGVYWDVTARKCAEKELQEANRRLQEMADTDTLTGLSNRRRFFEDLEQELLRIQRYGGALSLAMFDVDHFKGINDIYGHQLGDATLVEIASIMKATARGTDFVARLSGDEFIILMPNTEIVGAVDAAKRVLKKIALTRITRNNRVIPVTVSGGISVSHGNDGSTAASLIHLADRALYAAKLSGRNRVKAANFTPINK